MTLHAMIMRQYYSTMRRWRLLLLLRLLMVLFMRHKMRGAAAWMVVTLLLLLQLMMTHKGCFGLKSGHGCHVGFFLSRYVSTLYGVRYRRSHEVVGVHRMMTVVLLLLAVRIVWMVVGVIGDRPSCRGGWTPIGIVLSSSWLLLHNMLLMAWLLLRNK